MNYIGLDIGTKTIVVAIRDKDNLAYLTEINGYWLFERATPFIENMLNDPNKMRTDGTKRPARWIKLPETNQICVLGRDAEEFAYAKNDTLLRPMAKGGITANAEAMTVLAAIVQGLIEAAEKDVGQFTDEVGLCYCTTATAINDDLNLDYHRRVVDIIIGGYESKAKFKANNIKESHAIVIDQSQDGTGIGISFGAGTTTVTYALGGIEFFSFAWVGAGDWIDEQVAIRHGYEPNKLRQQYAKETPTTVCRRKEEIDLTPGNEPKDRVGLDIVLHYDVLIERIIDGIITGFKEHETAARINHGINIYLAGGTASPPGFTERILKAFRDKHPPFEIADIIRAPDPLFCVARGCLKAAEMS